VLKCSKEGKQRFFAVTPSKENNQLDNRKLLPAGEAINQINRRSFQKHEQNDMDHNNTTSIADPPAGEPKTRSGTTPELILVLTPKGIERQVFNTNTVEEQTELERLLQLIQPGLDAVNEVWKQSSAGQTV